MTAELLETISLLAIGWGLGGLMFLLFILCDILHKWLCRHF